MSEHEQPTSIHLTTTELKEQLAEVTQVSRKPLLIMLAAIAVVLVYALVSTGKTDSSGKPFRTPEQLTAQNLKIRTAIMTTYGGTAHNAQHLELVARIGQAIATRSDGKTIASKLRFVLLADTNAINSFALPTGEVFVTTALVNRMRTEGELAAVLANGTAHVLAKQYMDMPASPAPSIPSFTVKQESAVDADAIRIMSDAGYDPRAMLGMFEVLTAAYTAGADAQFFTTHPSEDDRLVHVQAAIEKLFPKGIPEILSK